VSIAPLPALLGRLFSTFFVKMKRSLVAGLAWALSAFLWASYYLGSDLTYQCLGPGTGNTTRYLLRFTLYRDCKGIREANSVTYSVWGE